MTITINTTTYDHILARIRANLKICGHADVDRLEMFIPPALPPYSSQAWLVERSSKGPYEAIIKGPSCKTQEEAFEGLLRATSLMVLKTNGDMFARFTQQRSIQVGESSVLERFYDELDAAMLE